MFDFDKSFADFVKRYMSTAKLSLEEMEDIIADLSVEWSILPQAALGGKSPVEYIENLSDPTALIAHMKAQSESNLLPQLYDRIIEVKGTAPLLIDILGSDESAGVKKLAFKLLTEKKNIEDFGNLLQFVLVSNGDDELVRPFVLRMEAHPQEATGLLLDAAKSENDENRLIIGEMLSYLLPDDRIYSYLVDLFHSAGNIPFTAALFARYGDSRAIEVMKDFAADCNYFEFVELRNAIESLGGDLDTDRDWSDDGYYEAIKND